MQIKINLSAQELEIIHLSKAEKYADPKSIMNGYELSQLIRSINESDLEELRVILEQLRETSANTIRTGVNYRIAADANEKIEKIAAQINARKSEVVRAIIAKRGKELQIGNSVPTSFSTAAWHINSKKLLPVSLLINEILRNNKVDLWAFSGYNKAALGRTDLKNFLADQGFGCYESDYLPGGKCDFLIVYNTKRFKLIAQLPCEESFILPLILLDKATGRKLVLVSVKVLYDDDVKAALEKIDKFLRDLQQKEEFKNHEIILQGDFRAIAEKIEEFKVFSSLTLCPSRSDKYSFVYENGFKNKIDHTYISNGLQSVKTAYKFDFITEEYYGKITPKDHITADGLPNHALMCCELRYK